MDNALIFQILGVLAVLFFIFITYMNTKTWHWPHVTFMFLVLPAAATAMVYSAMSLKTRAVWMTKAKALEPELETVGENGGPQIEIPTGVKAKQVSLFPILPSVTWNFKF